MASVNIIDSEINVESMGKVTYVVICIFVCCFGHATYLEAVAATVLFGQVSFGFKLLYFLPQLSILRFQCFNLTLNTFKYTFDDRFHQVGNLKFKRLLDLLSQSRLKRVLYDACHFLQVRFLEVYVSVVGSVVNCW